MWNLCPKGNFTRLVYSEKQKGRFFIELQLCFSEYARILVSKGTSRAFKLKNRNFRANCW